MRTFAIEGLQNGSIVQDYSTVFHMAVQYSNIDNLDIIDYHLFLPVRGRVLFFNSYDYHRGYANK